MALDRKLARWREAGLIDEATRARIEAFERGGRKPVVLYALAVLGAGTIALGIVSVVAANWDAIPGRVKLGVDLLLGFALAAMTYASIARGHRIAREVLITIFYGYTLASLALVGQVYQLATPAYQALLVWTAASLPLVLLGRSRPLGALVTAGLATTHVASLEALFEHLQRSPAWSAAAERNAMAALVFASPLAYVPLSRVPWLVRKRPEHARVLSTLAWTAVLLAGFAAQFVWYERLDRDDTLSWALGVALVVALALGAALPRLYPELPVRGLHALRWALGFGWLSLAAGTALPRASLDFAGAILQVAWLGLFAWAGLRLGLLRAFNALTALIAVRVLVIYFEVFGSMLSTGLGLISGGVLTLIAAWLWRRNIRALDAAPRAAHAGSATDGA